MYRWVVISLLIAAYLGLTLGVGLRAGRGTSSTVDGFVAEAPVVDAGHDLG